MVLAETEEQKMALLDNLLKETYIRDIVKRKIRSGISEKWKLCWMCWRQQSEH